MVEQILLNTNKICEEDPLADLNHSTKGAMTTYFLQRIFPIAFYQQKVSKTEIVKPTGASTNEIYQLEFLKIIA